MVDYDKPLSLSLLAYILFLIGLITIAFVTYVFFYEDEFLDYGLLAFLGAKIFRFLAVISFAMLLLISAIGLLKSSSWGRGLFIALNVIIIIHSLIMIFSGMIRGAVTLILCVIMTMYMYTQPVTSVFKPIDSRKAVSAIDRLDSYRKGRYYR